MDETQSNKPLGINSAPDDALLILARLLARQAARDWLAESATDQSPDNKADHDQTE
jgi:hypothetical protein